MLAQIVSSDPVATVGKGFIVNNIALDCVEALQVNAPCAVKVKVTDPAAMSAIDGV